MNEYVRHEEFKEAMGKQEEAMEKQDKEIKDIKENHLVAILKEIKLRATKEEVKNLRWFVMGTGAALAIVVAIVG